MILYQTRGSVLTAWIRGHTSLLFQRLESEDTPHFCSNGLKQRTYLTSVQRLESEDIPHYCSTAWIRGHTSLLFQRLESEDIPHFCSTAWIRGHTENTEIPTTLVVLVHVWLPRVTHLVKCLAMRVTFDGQSDPLSQTKATH